MNPNLSTISEEEYRAMIENAGAEWNAVTREEYKKMKIDGKLAGMSTRKITQHRGSGRNTTYQCCIPRPRFPHIPLPIPGSASSKFLTQICALKISGKWTTSASWARAIKLEKPRRNHSESERCQNSGIYLQKNFDKSCYHFYHLPEKVPVV